MGKSASIIADVFMKYLGIHETPGPKATAEIVRFFADTTYPAKSDEVPWCSAAACAVVDEARKTHPEIDESPHNAAAAAWAKWGVEVPDGEQDVGDIVTCDWNGDGHIDHVCVFLGENDEVEGEERVSVIGGNQSHPGRPDEVNIKWIALSSVVNFRRPRHYKES